MVRGMCGVQLKDGERSTNLVLALNEAIDWLAIVSSVHWTLMLKVKGRKGSRRGHG